MLLVDETFQNDVIMKFKKKVLETSKRRRKYIWMTFRERVALREKCPYSDFF